jgi:hypothetical protein
MNANEMFKKLGYTYREMGKNKNLTIVYKDEKNKKYMIFQGKYKTVTSAYLDDNHEVYRAELNFKELQAILEKMKELGWEH